MKRYFNIAVAALVIAGCAKENNPSGDIQPVVRKTIEVGLDATKTSLGTEVAGTFPVLWSEGDEIAVVDKMGVEGQQNCSVYRLKTGAGTSNGVFEHVSGNAFPAVIKDVIYPASSMAPQGVELDKIPVTSMEALVPKVQTQTYVKNSFDPKAAVMAFHSDADQQQTIVLQPASSIVCIPVVGQAGDVVTSVVWQNMDGRTVTVTLNCPGGVELSSKPTNFYLSIPPMTKNCNGIAYVHLKNGAVQVKTPRNMTAFKAGELHRFATWTLSKKTKWTIKYIGSERDHAITSQTPLGPGKYMIDDNPLSWWEFRRKLNSSKKPAMAGPHKVIIDLGKTEHITGLKVKGPETKSTATYKVDTVNVTPSAGYSAPFSVYASFLKDGELTDEYMDSFKLENWYERAQESFTAVAKNGIAYYYGEHMTKWWDLPLSEARDARYLVIHFLYGWNNKGTGSAASVMKVAELDIY